MKGTADFGSITRISFLPCWTSSSLKPGRSCLLASVMPKSCDSKGYQVSRKKPKSTFGGSGRDFPPGVRPEGKRVILLSSFAKNTISLRSMETNHGLKNPVLFLSYALEKSGMSKSFGLFKLCLLFILFFNWSVVDVQCYIGFRCPMWWFNIFIDSTLFKVLIKY